MEVRPVLQSELSYDRILSAAMRPSTNFLFQPVFTYAKPYFDHTKGDNGIFLSYFCNEMNAYEIRKDS